MSEPDSVFTRRGVPVTVETTEPAELDIKSCEISAEILEKAGRNLKDFPVLLDDVPLGPLNIRMIDNIDVVFTISRNDDAIVVTIVRFWPTPERDMMITVLKGLNLAALFRGATGI